MTAPAFPLSQLGRPTVDYTLKPADLRVRADTVSGLANSYNGSNAALTTISVKWEWGADNYAVFQDWYRNDCKDGSIEFTIADMYLFGALGTITARFTAPPKATYKSWNHYSVSATLETRTTDYISEATLDASLTNYEQPELLLQVVDGRILEETGHSTSVNGTVIVSATRTHDGYGSISNAADGQSTARGYFSITHPITLRGDFCIEGYWMPLVGSSGMTWLSSFPAPSVLQFQTWSVENTPSANINATSVISSSIKTSPNHWYHVAVERYNGIVTLYINGSPAGTYSYSGELSFDGIMLGNGPNENNIQSPCCWENVRILKRSVYKTAFTPPSRFESRPSDCPVWPSDVFGNPASDGYGEEAQSSSLRGKTEGYARPAMRRKSPVTVTQLPIKWNMSQANKILFDAWYHYKLVDGAGWFWLFTDFHGELNYMIKVRFTESISLKYESVDWWEISGTIETVEYNYLPLADCPTLVVPSGIAKPVITDQPDDVTQATGTTVTLSVTATTNEYSGELSYQWYFGSTAVSGATSASYSFTLSDTTDGGYHVVVSNDVGHVTSRTASVAILLLPDNVIANFSYDTNVTETSGYVTSWKDATGNFEFLGQASYVYGPQKVIGALYFAHSQLITAASLEASTGPTTQFTLIYVYKSASMTGAINGAVLLTCGNQDLGVQSYVQLVTSTWTGSESTWTLESLSHNHGAVSTVTTIPRVDSSYRIIFVTYDNGVVNCYDGNTLAGTITCPVTFNTRDASLGVIAGREWGEGTYNHPDLYVKEFDFYDRVLTSNERSLAIEYLKYRYNI